MFRGTTPTLEFIIPFASDQLAEAFVTLSQSGKVVVEKALSDCKCNENKLSVRLTQEDTLKLQCECITEIQIRARTLAGDVLASNIIRERTGRILKEGVI